MFDTLEALTHCMEGTFEIIRVTNKRHHLYAIMVSVRDLGLARVRLIPYLLPFIIVPFSVSVYDRPEISLNAKNTKDYIY